MFDYFSMMALPVKLYQDVNYLGPATAFCYEYNGNNYLVSNWHVFSGRNPDTGQPLSSTGAIPSKICILMHGIEPGSYYDEVSFELYGKNEEALWLQHQDGQTIDIAAINISELFAGPKLYFANAHEHLNHRFPKRSYKTRHFSCMEARNYRCRTKYLGRWIRRHFFGRYSNARRNVRLSSLQAYEQGVYRL